MGTGWERGVVGGVVGVMVGGWLGDTWATAAGRGDSWGTCWETMRGGDGEGGNGGQLSVNCGTVSGDS